jgi:hypothetical protein
MGTEFVTEYEGLVLDPKKMCFLPLNYKSNPNMVGLRICIDNYDVDIADKYKNAVYQVLDTILGEKATVTEIDYLDVDYLDVDNLSSYNADGEGLIKLVELPNFIKWHKENLK